VKSWGCTGSPFIRFPLMAAADVRRGSPDPAGVPDRRSPAQGVSFALKGICARGVHAEGRRPVLDNFKGSFSPFFGDAGGHFRQRER
jgi:hypothetical protein